MIVDGVLGVQAGTRFVTRVSDRVLKRISVVILVVVGCHLLLERTGVSPLPDHDAGKLAFATGISGIILALALGIVIGAYSAAMGLGGGLLTVPPLVLRFHTSMPTALGTSLIVMAPKAALSILAHARQHTIDHRTGLVLAAGTAPSAGIGVLVALVLPGNALSAVFGLSILLMAFREVRFKG